MTGFLLALAAVAALVAHMTGGLVLMTHQHPHHENEKERS